MKLRCCLSMMVQNKTLQANTKQKGCLNHLCQNCHWIPHHHLCWLQAFHLIYCKQFQKCYTDFSLHWSPLLTHTRASKIHKNLVQNITILTHAMCLEKNLLAMWQSLELVVVSNTENSVSSVTLLLQVAVQRLWHSAYMLLIDTCGIEANIRQSAPKATKGLSHHCYLCLVVWCDRPTWWLRLVVWCDRPTGWLQLVVWCDRPTGWLQLVVCCDRSTGWLCLVVLCDRSTG